MSLVILIRFIVAFTAGWLLSGWRGGVAGFLVLWCASRLSYDQAQVNAALSQNVIRAIKLIKGK